MLQGLTKDISFYANAKVVMHIYRVKKPLLFTQNEFKALNILTL